MTPVNISIVDDKIENIIALKAIIVQSDINLLSTTSPNEGLKIAWENDISNALVDVQMSGWTAFNLRPC